MNEASWFLGSLTCIGMFLIGRKKLSGWFIGILAGVGWIIYGIVTNQGGIVLESVVVGLIQIYALFQWRK